LKVISFKVEDEIYNQLKSLNKSFREVLEPLLIDYLQFLQSKASIHNGIQTKEALSYQDIAIIIDELILHRERDSDG